MKKKVMTQNLTSQQNNKLSIYRSKDGNFDVDVKMEDDTVWLDAHQMGKLYGIDRSGIVKHINNIYKTDELKKESTCAKIAQVAKDGKTRNMDIFNLDMIISVGYRVNSKKATNFRIWATKTLKDYLIKGYTINQKRLKDKGLTELEQAIELIKSTIDTKKISNSEARGLLKVITDYTNSWVLFQKYDEDKLSKPKTTKKSFSKISYKNSIESINELKKDLIKKKEATDIFGIKRDKTFEGIVKGIYQTFDKKELYPSIEEKSSHLLYFIIKDHPFTDGNKRIASLLFILFLVNNNYLFNKKGERKINDNTMVALALLIAQSDPVQKDVMIKLIMNFINEK